ncbi:hypothetical protein [Sphingopyxis sp. GC21]|uniref:hypothetical protein n=1 Tax=Sphingopyxis sp. GC21 TaxID=2933562 RepID=UPI0021E35A25|nr:hypothetical protein [Sphingopyxis sp. GC21]
MPGFERYVRTETIFSTIGTLVVTAFLYSLMFGFAGPVPVRGVGAYAFDFVPQAFMTALICIWVPGAMTRKRLARGAIAALPAMKLPASPLVLRGFTYGVLALLIGSGSVITALLLGEYHEIDWLVGLTGKLAFGGMVAAIATPMGLRALFRQASNRR